jgi:uncharacterized membrane protein
MSMKSYIMLNTGPFTEVLNFASCMWRDVLLGVLIPLFWVCLCASCWCFKKRMKFLSLTLLHIDNHEYTSFLPSGLIIQFMP